MVNGLWTWNDSGTRGCLFACVLGVHARLFLESVLEARTVGASDVALVSIGSNEPKPYRVFGCP